MAGARSKKPRRADGHEKAFKLNALTRAMRALTRQRTEDPRKQIKFEALEPRVLLSADPFTASIANPFGDDWTQPSETLVLPSDALAALSPSLERPVRESGIVYESDDPLGETLVLGRSLDEMARATTPDSWIIDASAPRSQQHVVFVDSRIEGCEPLLDDLLPVAKDGDSHVPVIEVVVLDADRDGVAQIGKYLGDKEGIAAIHILAHGSSGSLTLGSATLDTASLESYTAELGIGGRALTSNADILLYGCNVANGDWGADFIENLATLTGAEVAASDDLTGNALLGSNWLLEQATGVIEAATLPNSDYRIPAGLTCRARLAPATLSAAD